MNLKHRDNTCPMYNTCSSLGYISEECSINCYRKTFKEKNDYLLSLYQSLLKSETPLQTVKIITEIRELEVKK